MIFFISKFLFCFQNLQIKSKFTCKSNIKKTKSRKHKKQQQKKNTHTHTRKYNFFVQQAQIQI